MLLIVGREGSEKEASVSISSSISSSKVSGSAAMSRHDKKRSFRLESQLIMGAKNISMRS